MNYNEAAEGKLDRSNHGEEAIPERDPAYHIPVGTLHDAQTVEILPSAVRRVLGRCLEQFGMSAVRAAAVTAL